MAKILVAIPTFETVSSETFKSIWDLEKGNNTLDFECVKGYDCARARNEICTIGRERGYEYILMVDSDVVIPKDALIRMLEYDCGLVIGCCPRKNTGEGRIEIYKPGTFSFTDYYTYDTLPLDPRVEIKGGGFACALIKTDILNWIQYPYFKYITYEDDTSLSEDLYFCLQIHKAGFKIEADTRVRCGHLARYFQYR